MIQALYVPFCGRATSNLGAMMLDPSGGLTDVFNRAHFGVDRSRGLGGRIGQIWSICIVQQRGPYTTSHSTIARPCDKLCSVSQQMMKI